MKLSFKNDDIFIKMMTFSFKIDEFSGPWTVRYELIPR